MEPGLRDSTGNWTSHWRRRAARQRRSGLLAGALRLRPLSLAVDCFFATAYCRKCLDCGRMRSSRRRFRRMGGPECFGPAA